MTMQAPRSERIIASVAQPAILTYHCLCTHLLLASTQPLDALPQRALAGLDKAYILPLPPLPQSELDSDAESESDRPSDQEKSKVTPSSGYALLLSTTIDRNPQIVNREDGFEKRYLQRCGRCKLIVGYNLDWAQFAESKKEGRREDIVYLLQNGLVSTDDMAAAKPIEKTDPSKTE